MTDSVHILNGDELDEALLAEALGRTGISDYVERGLIPTAADVDFANAVVDVPAGKAFVLDNGRDVMLLPDARAGVQLATDGINHLFVFYDLSQPAGERIGYHVDSDGTPPAQPALEIAAIDMGAEEVRPQNDTAPIYRRDAETYKGNDIDSDGDGVVDEADVANTVTGPINVRNNGSAAQADNAATVGGIAPGAFVRGDDTQSAQERIATNDFIVDHPTSAGKVSLRTVRNQAVYIGSSTEPVRLRGPVIGNGHLIRDLALLAVNEIDSRTGSSIKLRTSLDFADAQRIFGLPDPNGGSQPVTRSYADGRYINSSSESTLDVAHADEANLADSATRANKADKVVFGDGTARQLQIDGSDGDGIVNFKTK